MELASDSNIETTKKTWLGSSISDMCKGKGPWSFSISPINASKYHAVLYTLPVTLKNPPKPHHNSQPQHWDDDYIRMPYSEKNLFPVTEEGKDVIKWRWNIIKESLSKPIKNSRELELAIMSYNKSLPRFLALHYFFDEVLEEEETQYFFSNLLPKIIKLALQLPDIVPGSLPLLKKDRNRSVSLSQVQVACLLANAFLCTFPWKKDVANYCPGVNFVRLFAAHLRPKRRNSVSEKLKCICHYFRRVTSKSPIGVLTFERKFVSKGSVPRWDAVNNNLGNTKVHINSIGTIEDDAPGFLQVDFANKNVGGGVLGYGCVQEEIRFVICPELLISRLFVEQLGDYEAVIVTGCERFSKYSGYGDTFTWEGNVEDETPYDEYGRRRTTVSIIDATRFNKPTDQFYPSAILRELNKAYVGFSSREKENLSPVATGNWGCGAYKGSSALKSLIQLMACSAAGRDLVYFSFGDENLREQFHDMYLFLAGNRITIVQLWRFLCGFSTSGASPEKLCSYIQQAFFDSKKQPTIKKFFGVSTKKEVDVSSASTSETKKSMTTKKTGDEKNVKYYKEQSKSQVDMDDVEFDEDIIPPTPPEELIHKNRNVKGKTQPHESIHQKLPKTDIVELIDIIDGNTNKSKGTNKEEQILSELDKLHNKCKISGIDENMSCEINERMDTNESVNSEILLNSSSCENKSSKRKITDYFQIKPFKSS